MRNILIQLFIIWTSGSGEDVILRYFLSTAMATILFGGAEPFEPFLVQGILRNNSVILF